MTVTAHPGLDGRAAPKLADLSLLIEPIRRELEAKQELGLLSVTVVRRRRTSFEDSWQDYDSVQREISLFLTHSPDRGVRQTDVVLEPVVSGNTYVVLLGPPRSKRAMDSTDIALVRQRLRRALREHLGSHIPEVAFDRFEIYVGASLMRFAGAVECQRIVYRCLEESVADAMEQHQAEAERQAAHLRRIIRKNWVHSVYQPLVDLSARQVFGFEALTRVPKNPFASPEPLFRLAADSGALWSLERLCRRRALEALPAMDPAQLLFLNIERQSLEDPELLGQRFLHQLQRVGLRPNQVVLELTERSSIEDFAAIKSLLDDSRRRGFRMAMDDVGAGHSGLQAIAELQPDFLKIDMGLVRDLHLHKVKRELIAMIYRFSESTGTTLIAEGVETLEELASLRGLGVRRAQGYLFSKPGRRPLAPDWPSLDRTLESPENGS